ncbi:hypothetical protein C8F01DRAFT_175082 [Mycena amicta]|nr:hypothetical protein C8F01DRAFT_175082 [Mycena amicta]
MSNNTTSPILLADPITAIGPIFLGNSFNCLLLGTLAMQVYAYWRRYPKDPLFVKALVYGIFAMDFVQTGFGIHESWWYAIENWGNIASLQHGPWTALITPIICGINLLCFPYLASEATVPSTCIRRAHCLGSSGK